MTGNNGRVDADESAGLVARTDERRLETTGCFRHANGGRLPG